MEPQVIQYEDNIVQNLPKPQYANVSCRDSRT